MKCSVPNCASKCKDRKGKSFFRFPKDTILRKKWIEAIGRLDYVPKDNNVICEDHFIESDFNNDLKTVCRIKRGAVPSINIPKPEEISTLAVSVSKNKLVRPPALQIKTNVVPAYLPNQHTKITMPAEIRAVAVDVLKNELVRPPALQINTNVAPAYLPNQHTKITMPAEVRAVAVDVLKNELVRPPALQMNTNVAPAYLPNQHAKITMPEEIRAVAADVSKKELIRPSALQPIKKDVVPAYLPIQHADIIIEESCETVINQETRRPLNSNKMKCEVFCCPNKRRKTRGKSFFRFPRDKETADLWLREIGREGAVINDNRFVCEDHFEESYIFQWKDRKVIDKEATPFHDYRACPICSDPNKKEEDIHPGRRKREKPEKPKKVKSNRKKVKSNRKNPCSSGFKSDNFVLDASQDFFKEEMEIDESSYNNINPEDIREEEIDWAQTDEESSSFSSSIYSDERIEEFCEKQNLKEVITSLTVDPLKYEIEEIPVEDIYNEHTTNIEDIKPETVEIVDSDDENSEHKIYEGHENLAQRNSSSPHNMACVEYIQGSCRVCLTNCFNGQSIFKNYKKKFLPDIILILTGIHVTKDDELPSMICFSCANLLVQAESIRNMCLTSDKFLKHQKEFKIKMESFDTDVFQRKLNLEERLTEYSSIKLDRDMSINSTQKQSMPDIDRMEANAIKEEIQSDTEVNEEIFQDQVHCNEKFEKIAEDDHHTVERLDDNDIDDQHCDEERLEEENEDQFQDKEILDEVKTDELSDKKYDNETFRLSSELDTFDGSDANDDFGGAFEIFECSTCSKQFEDKKSFDRHSRTHIQKKRKCPVCPKELTLRAMQLHLATHKEINKLICDRCGVVFNNVLILFKHLRQHKTNTKGNPTYVHRCDICDFEIVALSAYQTHMKNMHGFEDPKPFKCKQCQMRFTRKTAMNRHIDNVHNRNPANRIRNFLCNICGKNFYVKFHLEIHMRSHTGERPYKCKYCGKAFTQISALRTHEYIHTGEKPFACKHCGKKFKQYGHLMYHQQTHAEGFPYVCKICNHKFKIRTNLNIHMKLHSKKQFSCKICQKAYVWPCKLKEHFRKSHPGVQISELEDTLDLLEES